jgi:FixJ family two-component response regulator
LPEKPIISIVDDNEAHRNALKGLMRALGFPVESFASAEDFLQCEELRKTDCLILDVQMPNMSGLDLHRHLMAAGIIIPTILMTAYPDDGIRTLALEAGVIGFLAKPLNKDHLLACIHTAIDRGGKRAP